VLPVLDEFLFGRFGRYASAESKLLSEFVCQAGVNQNCKRILGSGIEHAI